MNDKNIETLTQFKLKHMMVTIPQSMLRKKLCQDFASKHEKI